MRCTAPQVLVRHGCCSLLASAALRLLDVVDAAAPGDAAQAGSSTSGTSSSATSSEDSATSSVAAPQHRGDEHKEQGQPPAKRPRTAPPTHAAAGVEQQQQQPCRSASRRARQARRVAWRCLLLLSRLAVDPLAGRAPTHPQHPGGDSGEATDSCGTLLLPPPLQRHAPHAPHLPLSPPQQLLEARAQDAQPQHAPGTDQQGAPEQEALGVVECLLGCPLLRGAALASSPELCSLLLRLSLERRALLRRLRGDGPPPPPSQQEEQQRRQRLADGVGVRSRELGGRVGGTGAVATPGGVGAVPSGLVVERWRGGGQATPLEGRGDCRRAEGGVGAAAVLDGGGAAEVLQALLGGRPEHLDHFMRRHWQRAPLHVRHGGATGDTPALWPPPLPRQHSLPDLPGQPNGGAGGTAAAAPASADAHKRLLGGDAGGAAAAVRTDLPEPFASLEPSELLRRLLPGAGAASRTGLHLPDVDAAAASAAAVLAGWAWEGAVPGAAGPARHGRDCRLVRCCCGGGGGAGQEEPGRPVDDGGASEVSDATPCQCCGTAWLWRRFRSHVCGRCGAAQASEVSFALPDGAPLTSPQQLRDAFRVRVLCALRTLRALSCVLARRRGGER